MKMQLFNVDRFNPIETSTPSTDISSAAYE